MSRSLIERRLADTGDRLRAVREQLQIADEQLAHLSDLSEEAEVRALVSETPMADREHTEAKRHADAMARHRADLVEQIRRLERQQDDLLDRLMAEPR